MYACLICLVLYSTNKILREIVLLFSSNFFQSLNVMETLYLSNYIDQKRLKIRYSLRGFLNFFYGLMQLP